MLAAADAVLKTNEKDVHDHGYQTHFCAGEISPVRVEVAGVDGVLRGGPILIGGEGGEGDCNTATFSEDSDRMTRERFFFAEELAVG